MEKIKLDLIPSGKMPSLHASQYDDGREHGIDLFENGVVYKLDGTETLTINERKGDDCICSLDIENTFADSNHIVFASTEQMCAVWGNNICELVIAKGEKTIGTLNFILEIEQSPTEGGIESESEIKNLERQIEAITEEIIGDNYYTAEETDEAIADATEGKADKTYVDTELDKKADKDNTYTKSEVDTLIDNLPEPMIFKGTLGVGGTIQTLPTASASNEGFTYKVITDGTYAGQTAKVGDVFTSNGSAWVLIPSGDEDNDTWRAIKVEGVEVLGNGISSGAVDFVGSENIEVDFDGNGNKVEVKTKNIYTKEQVDDIVYGILPDDTASGSVANFETDLALPIKSLEIDVNAKQDLHGYDYPWVGGAGKNIVDFASYFTEGETVTQNGVTATFSNGYLKVTGTNTSSTFNIVYKNSPVTLPAGTYIMPSNLNIQASVDGGANVNYNSAITAESSVKIQNFYVFAATGATVNYNIPMMLVKGTTRPTEYEPYENICPIEGWSEIKSVHTGKNLLNLEDWEVNQGVPMIISNGTITLSNSGYQENNNSYTLLNNASYTLSFHFKTIALTNANTSFAVYADGNKVIPEIGGTGTGNILLRNVGYENDVVIKLSGKNKISFGGWAYQGTVEVSNIQLELGSTATEYEPYNGNTKVIELGGTYYGGYVTQDKDGHRELVLNKTRVDLGSLSWTQHTNGFYMATKTNEMFRYLSTETPDWKAEKYQKATGQWIYGHGSNVGYIGANGGLIYCTDSTTPSGYLVAPLTEPIIIPLADGEPLSALIGTNNLFADTGDTSVVFKDSVNGYVERNTASVQALALNT